MIHLAPLFPHCFVCDFIVVKGVEEEKGQASKKQVGSGELEEKKGMKGERSGRDGSLSSSEFGE